MPSPKKIINHRGAEGTEPCPAPKKRINHRVAEGTEPCPAPKQFTKKDIPLSGTGYGHEAPPPKHPGRKDFIQIN